jgi:hypothetical protein
MPYNQGVLTSSFEDFDLQRRSPPGNLLVAMARSGGQTDAGERHERSDTTVGWVASAVAGVGDSVHPARLGACGAVGHRDGAVLGSADQPRQC